VGGRTYFALKPRAALSAPAGSTRAPVVTLDERVAKKYGSAAREQTIYIAGTVRKSTAGFRPEQEKTDGLQR
jgi:hypothetical protein